MLSVISALLSLRWTQTPQFHPLPSNIERTFTCTATGELELLTSSPTSTTNDAQTPRESSTPPPIFFVHGGCGSASVWLDWMTYLQPRYSGRTYAYSLRNHGASFSVGYMRFVFGTTFDELASDLIATIDRVKELEGDIDPVIVAHSSGGGLAQYVLAKKQVKTAGLVLVGAVPHFGNLDAYWNWWRHDPWFPLRSLFHLYHPNSPLSTPELVRGAFFGPLYQDRGALMEFTRWMPNYEAMGWPAGMAGSLGKWWRGRNEWLSTKEIVDGLVKNKYQNGDRVCIMVGSKDMLMDINMSRRAAQEYRDGLVEMMLVKKLDNKTICPDIKSQQILDGVYMERQGGVRLVVIENAGHHTQNDVQRDKGAEALKDFAEQLQ